MFGVTFEQGRNDLKIDDATMLQNIVTENQICREAASAATCIIALIALKYTQSNSVCYVQGRPGHRRGRGPAEPHPLHPPGRQQGRQLAAAPACPRCWTCPSATTSAAPNRDNAIDVYIGDTPEDVHRRRRLGRDLHRAARRR